jgi:hypothetical protein
VNRLPAMQANENDWGPLGIEPEGHVQASEERITKEMDRERERREARRRLDAEERGPIEIPTFETLQAQIATAVRTVAWRIDGWQPEGTRCLLAAQFKGGKTIAVGNVTRSLVDGDAFLGVASVVPVQGTVVILDFEMSDTMLNRWLKDQAIRNTDRVIPVAIKGRTTTFNILDAQVRREWALRLRQARTSYLIVDCLRPIMDALGLDEHRDAGRFLVALDALLAEAGITEALIVHHMGHTGERSRGDSRLRDWPDVEWRLVRQDDDPASPRFVSAYGRDVDVAESRLEYEPSTRRLTLAGGSRRDARSVEILPTIIAALRDAGTPLSGRAIKEALKDTEYGRNAIDAALRFGASSQCPGTLRLWRADGERNAKLYRAVSVP